MSASVTGPSTSPAGWCTWPGPTISTQPDPKISTQRESDGHRVGRRLTRPGYDHDRTGRVVRDLAAHRAHQEPGKPAAAASPHDEHVGAIRGIDEFFRSIPRDHTHGDLGQRSVNFVRDAVHELLSRRPRKLRVKAVLGIAGY